MILIKHFVLLAIAVALLGNSVEAGFRCSVVGGLLSLFSSDARAKNQACSASCVALGYSSGKCDSDGECK